MVRWRHALLFYVSRAGVAVAFGLSLVEPGHLVISALDQGGTALIIRREHPREFRDFSSTSSLQSLQQTKSRKVTPTPVNLTEEKNTEEIVTNIVAHAKRSKTSVYATFNDTVGADPAEVAQRASMMENTTKKQEETADILLLRTRQDDEPDAWPLVILLLELNCMALVLGGITIFYSQKSAESLEVIGKFLGVGAVLLEESEFNEGDVEPSQEEQLSGGLEDNTAAGEGNERGNPTAITADSSEEDN